MLPQVTVRMTQAMFEDSKRLADECRIPHAEWIRRCMCWGTVHPDVMRQNQCLEQYRVQTRGWPADN